ncbi:hypothetical protein BDD12DRAFT_950868 [Trichophaea hybrida]|nr:hypothetical protein BDD12DRAFT_950868 [Trichophaea hybrida]
MKEKLKKIDSGLCWWCETGARQTRHHLFTECRAFKPQIRRLWKEVGDLLNWKHPLSRRISYLFKEEKVTEVVLQFLRDTGVGKIWKQPVPGRWEDVEREEWGPPSGEEEAQNKRTQQSFAHNQRSEERGGGDGEAPRGALRDAEIGYPTSKGGGEVEADGHDPSGSMYKLPSIYKRDYTHTHVLNVLHMPNFAKHLSGTKQAKPCTP